MFEMLYGNTGKRDEGININMEASLYQKLASRTIVPKFKSMLSDAHQQGDKSFVYIGEVVDKSGSFTVYGYNAKLEGDSRGGDYGHYVVEALNEKAAVADFASVNFLTEDGFIEYVNAKTLNDSKRFSLSPVGFEIDENAKKRIVNNLMETFMKVRKRKTVAFCFEETTVEEFSQKSVGILIDVLKYLPYRMRKNVAFVSHLCSNAKADTLNLVAYPTNCSSKPHDCINVEEENAPLTDGLFTAYVDKVFAFTDAEREEYFEKLYNEIEAPALSKGVDVRSDLYLLDVSTKVLWAEGDIDEAVRNIASLTVDVLKVYPQYCEIAKARLMANKDAVISYTKEEAEKAYTATDLKNVYLSVMDLSDTCGLDLGAEIVAVIKARGAEFIRNTFADETLIGIADGIVDINPDALDCDAVTETINKIMATKTDLYGIYALYSDVLPKKYISDEELGICLSENTDNFIIRETAVYSQSKDKLSKLEDLFEDFKRSCPDVIYPLVTDVYNRYKGIFSGDASSEAEEKGNVVLDKISSELMSPCTIWDIKEFVQSISLLETEHSEALKEKACYVYAKVTEKLYDNLDSLEEENGEFFKYIEEATPFVKTINEKGIFDGRANRNMLGETVVNDGMFRFITLFGSLISSLDECHTMAEALKIYDSKNRAVLEEEFRLRRIFNKFGPLVIADWIEKNPKAANGGKLKKALKTLVKKENIRISEQTKKVFNIELEGAKGSKKGGKGKLIIIIAAVVLAVVLGVVGFFIGKAIIGGNDAEVPTDTTEDVVQYIERADYEIGEAYMNGFDAEGKEDAKIVIGYLEPDGESAFILHIADMPADKNAPELKAEVSGDHSNSKKYYSWDDMTELKKYAMVIQKAGEDADVDYYVYDFFKVPEDINAHDYSTEYKDELLPDEEAVKFCTAITRYIAYEKNVLTLNEAEKPAETQNKESSDGEEQKSEKPKDEKSAN